MKKPASTAKKPAATARTKAVPLAAKKVAVRPKTTVVKTPRATIPTKTAAPVAKKSSPITAVKKATAKPVAAKSTKVTPAAKEKAKKQKLVRDSFTMPEAEYQVLDKVKKECLKAGFEIKKSQLLRIGVALIGKMELASVKNVLATLPPLKTGRPKKD